MSVTFEQYKAYLQAGLGVQHWEQLVSDLSKEIRALESQHTRTEEVETMLASLRERVSQLTVELRNKVEQFGHLHNAIVKRCVNKPDVDKARIQITAVVPKAVIRQVGDSMMVWGSQENKQDKISITRHIQRGYDGNYYSYPLGFDENSGFKPVYRY